MIPVLFTQENSKYLDSGVFECYDLHRNAFTFTGRKPLIAHPPCRLFSRLRKFSNANLKEKQCAYFALDKIRRYGGILEHPRSSTLWKTGNFNLTGDVDSYGGFLRSVNLTWFGFPAQKKTMLYFVGITPSQLPPIPFSLDAPTHTISTSAKKRLPEIKKSARSETTYQMIAYFFSVMAIIYENKYKSCTIN